MELKIIKTKADYNKAVARLEMILDAKKGTKEGDEFELLSFLIDDFENKKIALENPDPIAAIEFRLEQLGFGQAEFAQIIGLKSRASEVLKRKRKLNLNMIRKIQDRLQIPAEVLVQAY